ncbi:hypothetical protein OK074_6675 [Actinobacteria bacterium OK074]|nr:hypothetical protein OK074_6675 [Actinobacteria bacterium OK074]
MTSNATIKTDHEPAEATELVMWIREFGIRALPLWEPPGGWADPTTVDLRAVQAGLRRLIS